MNKEDFITAAVRGAAECLQWQASDLSQEGKGYPIADGGDEYTSAVEDAVRETVEDFVGLVIDSGLWERVLDVDRYTRPAFFGHDFILSANGHGTGFSDRGLGWLGDRLHYLTAAFSINAEFELWGDEADDDLHCRDEVRSLHVADNAIVISGVATSQLPR